MDHVICDSLHMDSTTSAPDEACNLVGRAVDDDGLVGRLRLVDNEVTVIIGDGHL